MEKDSFIHNFPRGISAMWSADRFKLVSPSPSPTTFSSWLEKRELTEQSLKPNDFKSSVTGCCFFFFFFWWGLFFWLLWRSRGTQIVSDRGHFPTHTPHTDIHTVTISSFSGLYPDSHFLPIDHLTFEKSLSTLLKKNFMPLIYDIHMSILFTVRSW